MSRSLLVLGGSEFVGRALVEAGLARGWKVTTFNRGRASDVDPRVHRIIGDRLDSDTLAPLRRTEWDVVADTWSGAPRAVSDTASVLSERVDRYAYVSSRSVYAEPVAYGADESAATVEASPTADAGTYAERKRGAEVAVEEAFGARSLIARPGLIVGPHENVGRLTWWLLRVARAGRVLAPGPRGLSLQLIDARDLAEWMLEASTHGVTGAYNAVCRPDHATTESLLTACVKVTQSTAELVWIDPNEVLAAGIEPWNELPIWIPAGHPYRPLHEGNVERAYAEGLRCRPLADTVADTWHWLGRRGLLAPTRDDLPAPGLDVAKERAVLDALA